MTRTRAFPESLPPDLYDPDGRRRPRRDPPPSSTTRWLPSARPPLIELPKEIRDGTLVQWLQDMLEAARAFRDEEFVS
jgi:hypothetical protein